VHFEASVDIHSPADRIWSILTDAAAYPDWDSGVTRVEGRIADGLMSRSIPDLQPSFDRFVRGLKARAETG
jgi:hypothetical protein